MVLSQEALTPRFEPHHYLKHAVRLPWDTTPRRLFHGQTIAIVERGNNLTSKTDILLYRQSR